MWTSHHLLLSKPDGELEMAANRRSYSMYSAYAAAAATAKCIVHNTIMSQLLCHNYAPFSSYGAPHALSPNYIYLVSSLSLEIDNSDLATFSSGVRTLQLCFSN